jgi:EAL domain-containing protein (putative c-di-GMP-specific phosphodiesterase class I)
MNVNAWERQQARLRAALRGDEFQLYLQPIVALERPGDWRMAEVLIRLRQEEQALLPPGEFLPAFELFGMLPELDGWVLRKVAQREAGGAPRFSINVSAQTLEHEGFLRLLGDLAPARGSVLFEIEESDIVARPDAARRFCQSLRRCGAGVVIDGFGRRAPTFAAFAHLQPDFVKIDAALTRTIARDEACLARLHTVARLAESLGTELIAECIETPEVLLQLASVGIGHAQGYGICVPRPMEELLGRELRLAAA